jgi:hypothetical protein
MEGSTCRTFQRVDVYKASCFEPIGDTRSGPRLKSGGANLAITTIRCRLVDPVGSGPEARRGGPWGLSSGQWNICSILPAKDGVLEVLGFLLTCGIEHLF